MLLLYGVRHPELNDVISMGQGSVYVSVDPRSLSCRCER